MWIDHFRAMIQTTHTFFYLISLYGKLMKTIINVSILTLECRSIYTKSFWIISLDPFINHQMIFLSISREIMFHKITLHSLLNPQNSRHHSLQLFYNLIASWRSIIRVSLKCLKILPWPRKILRNRIAVLFVIYPTKRQFKFP